MKKLNPDLEWYVESRGGKPYRVLISRRDAIYEFSKGFTVTQAERRALNLLYENGLPVGEAVLLVGYGKNPDRVLTRVHPALIGVMP